MTTTSADPPGAELDQTANLLGALSLVIADRMADEMAGAGGRPESAAAALSALLHFLDSPTIDQPDRARGREPQHLPQQVDRR